MRPNQIDIYSNLFFNCFREDPGVSAQLFNLERGDELFKAQCRGEIEAFGKAGLLTAVGEDDGIMVAFSSQFTELPEYIQILQESSKYIFETANSEELAVIIDRANKALIISQPDWYKKFVTNVYILQIIAVNPKMCGKGVFRKLITPLIEKSDKEKIPVALQTYNPDNLKKYEHFGFKIMESVSSKELNLTCYNMLRYPE
ncbi:MAG: hypothetical protein Q4Q53_08535 [Methanocorpusculum sp.]|nr:hypothetical protein [Methanocorpusculum sp.]